MESSNISRWTAFAAMGSAQTPRATFEVASVKPNLCGSSRVMGRAVFDRTGLRGVVFDIRYSPLSTAPSNTPNAPELPLALQEQLGLRLEPARGPIDVRIIDSVAPPTEN
jgi:uncharacterized protein (TIGR03435 family)